MLTGLKSWIIRVSGIAVSMGVIFISLTAAAESARVFPIQSFSVGSSADVWVVRTDSTIEYCRSEQRDDEENVIACYPQSQLEGQRFSSVEAVISSDPAVASAYAMTSSGQLVYCRVSGNSKQSKNVEVRCHL
ncbi:hypothetical protein [Neptunomonas antarctica]|uniref:Uncharacterized protein n=1 Tax=Neptunomonas antarctica TaxID=619304 RepID=A0A1N7MY95_9GAMM|nr:hypothetical protein [Neptunomonas antarctica]SIS91087.1 hypothetical protein SAMN05421760_107114 [Neptunomonas antarctica]